MAEPYSPLSRVKGFGFVDHVDDLTPEWLSAVLDKAVAYSTNRVVAVESEPVGNGMAATTMRLHLTYQKSRTADRPKTLVAKYTSVNEASRNTGAALGIYRKEVMFYRAVAPFVAAAVPQAIYADVDEKGERFLLLMEDLYPARSGDQIAGCGLQDAEAAIRAIADIHAPFWDNDRLGELTWIDRDRDASLFADGYKAAVTSVVERYAAVIPEELRKVALLFGERVHDYYAQQPRPWTVTHQDFRLDNVLFDAKGGTMPVAVVDWQTVRKGPGVSDVAYFIGAGLSPALRRAHEAALLENYLTQLESLGVHGLCGEEAWRQYSLFAAEGLITAVVAANMLAPTERGDRMFVAMIERHAEHMRDLDTLSMIG